MVGYGGATTVSLVLGPDVSDPWNSSPESRFLCVFKLFFSGIRGVRTPSLARGIVHLGTEVHTHTCFLEDLEDLEDLVDGLLGDVYPVVLVGGGGGASHMIT